MPKLTLLKQPYEINFSRNPIVAKFRVDPYSIEEQNLETRIVVQLWAETSHYNNDFQMIKSVALYPSRDGTAEIDFQKQLDGLVEFETPIQSVNRIHICTKQAVRFYIRYSLANKYEQNIAPVTTANKHVLKGGMAEEQWDPKKFHQEKLIAGKNFLRYGYSREELPYDAKQWFYFINHGNSFYGFACEFRPHFAVSNTLGYKSISWTFAPVMKFQILACPVDIKSLDLEANMPPGDFIDSVNVKALIIGTTAAEYTYYVDYKNYYNKKTLHYFNSLGGLDTVVLKGEISHTSDYERLDMSKMDVTRYSLHRVLKPVDSYAESRERESLKGDTGFISFEQLDRLRDLLNSEYAYERNGEKIKAIRIVTQNAKIFSNRDKLHSLQLDWQEAFSDRNYTPKGFISDIGACPDVEFFEVTQEVAGKPRVKWKLPEGYDTIEVQMWIAPLAQPNNDPNTTFRFKANEGQADLNYPFVIPNNQGVLTYFWAKVVCDDKATPNVSGPWTGPLTFTVLKYLAPLLRNDYTTTFKGSVPRILNFNGGHIGINDQMRNNGINLQYLLPNSYGSAGGYFALNPTNMQLTYTPPTTNFTGTDVVEIQAYELISYLGPQLSPTASSKVYVTVEGGSISGTGQGLPYVHLAIIQSGPPGFHTSNNVLEQRADMHVEVYSDPFGTQPWTGPLNFNLILEVSLVDSNGNVTSLPNSTFQITQQTQYLGVITLWSQGGNLKTEVHRKVLPSSQYLIS